MASRQRNWGILDEAERGKASRNRLGIKGWALGGRWGYERYLYTLHRISGLALVLYFVLHIVVTSSKALGIEAWERTMGRVTGPVFSVGEFLVFAAFAFHALNGIRLVIIELGWGVGRPIEPVYPYKTSVGVQRPLAVGAMILAVGLAVLGGVDILVLH